MADLRKLQEQRDRILSIISIKGPVLPVQVARNIGVLPLFASAFLAELFSQKRLKMSNLKVGSSPLYFLPGQEEKLEDFVEHLNTRERDAFYFLKENQVLEDSELESVFRVALRAIKDFAVPIRVRVNGEVKTFWKYFGGCHLS